MVECRSDFTYAEKPTALNWEGTRLEVARLLASWRTPAARFFRLQMCDGRVFEALYSEASDAWQVQPL